MRLGGKITAAIEILDDFQARRRPLKITINDWARDNRFAGAKDRAWISGLCLDVLRRYASLAWVADSDTSRARVLSALRFLWRVDTQELAVGAGDQHGPGALSETECALLAHDTGVNDHPLWSRAADDVRADIPVWCAPLFQCAFGNNAVAAGLALASRADIDLRVNSLKADPEKACAALSAVAARPAPFLKGALRIAAPDASLRAPAVTSTPAFNKGWVEVQDLGSQIAAAAAGNIKGLQVFDYCAGGGGKTLALAAMMGNTGQLYAYDSDAHRLAPLFERARRAGVRNLQIRSPMGGEGLADLQERMDVVFVDAPCTGSGTWRRHPDAKWRLSQAQLARRMRDQEQVLASAAQYVKPGGQLVYVTCSVFDEENQQAIDRFCAAHAAFHQVGALENMTASGAFHDDAREHLSAMALPTGAVRIAPHEYRADGFFIAVLKRRGDL